MSLGSKKEAVNSFLRYCASSLACTALDYGLYSLFMLFLRPEISYIPARVISAFVNYQLNRRQVFKAAPSAYSAAGYALLSGLNAAAGWGGVKLLVGLGAGSYSSKLALDACLFVANFFIQRFVLFRKKQTAKP